MMRRSSVREARELDEHARKLLAQVFVGARAQQALRPVDDLQQGLGHGVVQLAADAGALVLAGPGQPQHQVGHPVLLFPALPVEAGVLDGDGREGGDALHDADVLVGEAVVLPGLVDEDAADDTALVMHGYPEHGDEVEHPGQLVVYQRVFLAVLDDDALSLPQDHPASLQHVLHCRLKTEEGADCGALRVAGKEHLQALAGVVQDPYDAAGHSRHIQGGVDHAGQDHRQVEVGGDEPAHLQQGGPLARQLLLLLQDQLARQFHLDLPDHDAQEGAFLLAQGRAPLQAEPEEAHHLALNHQRKEQVFLHPPAQHLLQYQVEPLVALAVEQRREVPYALQPRADLVDPGRVRRGPRAGRQVRGVPGEGLEEDGEPAGETEPVHDVPERPLQHLFQV